MSIKDLYKNKISTSHGLIVYTYTNDEIQFLMTLRRDTFCYECIIRGMYPTEDILIDYISHITMEEKERIQKYSFDNLWKDLWVSTKRRLYRIEYKKAKEKFIQNYNLIMDYVNRLVIFDNVLWEFPKGKMFSEENPLQCAMREFEEETNISSEKIMILKTAGIFEEAFFGNDHRKYQSMYFLGYMDQGESVSFHYQECPHGMRDPYVSDEVMSINWFSYEEAFKVCSPTKQKILQNVYSHLFGMKH